MRWTTPDQWHVTLVFLGRVGADRLPVLVEALASLRGEAAADALLGPATRRLGRSVLMVPVAGLDHLAGAARQALVPADERGSERSFTGHLTLARAGGRAAVPRSLVGAPVGGRWPVEEVTLVRSRLDPAGARYQVVGRVGL